MTINLTHVGIRIGAMLMVPVGLLAGVALAFFWVFFFVDQDPTGGGDIGAGFSFLALAFMLGLAGLGLGIWGCRTLLARLLASKSIAVGG